MALAIAPRLITGAELALVLLLEVILGPLWVFWAYGETPSKWTLMGGPALVLVLALHEIFPLVFPTKSTPPEEEGNDLNGKNENVAPDDESSGKQDAESVDIDITATTTRHGSLLETSEA